MQFMCRTDAVCLLFLLKLFLQLFDLVLKLPYSAHKSFDPEKTEMRGQWQQKRCM